jgi:hypothetical protein
MWYLVITIVWFYVGFKSGINSMSDNNINNQLYTMQDRIDLANDERDRAKELAVSWERRYNYLVSIVEDKKVYDTV